MIEPAGRLLARVDRAAGGLAADLVLYAGSGLFAVVTAATSTLLPHRAWGAIAAWGYAAAAILVTGQMTVRWTRAQSAAGHGGVPAGRGLSAYAVDGTRVRAALGWLTGVAAALIPLVVEAVQRAGGRADRAQEEVLVVERMGARLVHDGTPYLGPEAIGALPAGERLTAYSPYQPGMAIFGLPRAVTGDHWWTDARVWFAVVTVAALVAAVRLLPRTALRVRPIQAVSVLPICPLTLATGGDDLPVLALSLLALALSGAGRYGRAGLAVGAAAACKLFALPVVAVLVVLAIATGHGRRLIPGAVGLPLAALVPPVLIDPDAVVENVLRFPLGHGLVASPAQSPFPGRLISQSLPGGRYLAAALLVTIAAAITVRLVHRPPRNAAQAAAVIGWGLLAAILLMPTTRFGYLLYPAAFLAWATAFRDPQQVHRNTSPAR